MRRAVCLLDLLSLVFLLTITEQIEGELTHTLLQASRACGNWGAETNSKPGLGRWKIRYAGCSMRQNQKGNEKPWSATLKSNVWRGHRSHLKEKTGLLFCLFTGSVYRERGLPRWML